MSKAFTREEDDAGEEIPVNWPPLPPGARNYITPDGARGLKERLQNLQQKKESAEATGLETKKLESVIRNLKQRLDSLVMVEPPTDVGKIAVGAIVTVRHRDGEEETYRIVGVDESDPQKGAISWISPLAKALLSRRAGERVRFRIPAGEDELEILSVRY
jgi:transcription elongation factor GreB